MSELWICREQKARRPFRIKAAGVEVRTMEELCFYLYQSRELLDEAVMGEELFAWLAGELKLPRLAATLAEERKQGKNALWCAYFLLKESGMYAEEELAKIKELCLAMESKDAFELGKLRADRFLQKKQYLRSIREYQRLTLLGEKDGCSRKLMGNVWHDLGVAYARLFLFGEAAECFAKAYELNRKDESFAAWQEVRKMAGEQEQMGKGEWEEPIAVRSLEDGAWAAWNESQTEQESAVREEPECGWDDYLEELKTSYRESVQ